MIFFAFYLVFQLGILHKNIENPEIFEAIYLLILPIVYTSCDLWMKMYLHIFLFFFFFLRQNNKAVSINRVYSDSCFDRQVSYDQEGATLRARYDRFYEGSVFCVWLLNGCRIG